MRQHLPLGNTEDLEWKNTKKRPSGKTGRRAEGLDKPMSESDEAVGLLKKVK